MGERKRGSEEAGARREKMERIPCFLVRKKWIIPPKKKGRGREGKIEEVKLRS